MSSFPTRHAPAGPGDVDGRLDSIATWLTELEERVRAAELLKGDEKTAKELRKAVEAVAKHDPKLEERLENRVDVLADRFATLATTVSTTTSALAGKDGEIAALRRELDQRFARVEAAAATAPAPRTAPPGAEVEELRKALAAISAQKLPKNIESRIDDLKASVGVFTQRLETLSSTVSTTAAGLAGREGEVAALRRQLDEGNGGVRAEIASLRAAIDPAPIAELRDSVKRLAGEASVLKRDDQRRFDATKASFEHLSGRVEAAITALSETTSRVTASDEILTGLRAEYGEESARVDSVLVKLHQATSELAGRVAELGGAASAATVDGLVAELGDVAGRVDQLAATVSETATGYAAREYEIAALSRRFEEISAHVDEGVRELRTSVESIVERGVDTELEHRVDAFAAQLATIEAGIAGFATAADTEKAETAAAIAALGAQLAELRSRLESAAQDSSLEGRVDHLDHALGGLASELAKLGTALSTRAAEAAGAYGTLETRLEELADLVPTPERAVQVDGRLAELAARVSTLGEESSDRREAASSGLSALGQRLSDLEARLADAARDRTAEDARLANELGAWADQRDALVSSARALEERVAELGSSVDQSAASVAALEASLAASAKETVERETETRALSDRFHEASGRVDALVAELRRALETMPASTNADVVEEELAAVEARVAELEQTRGAAALEIARAATTWSEERTSIGDELGALAGVAREWSEERARINDRIEQLVVSLGALEDRPAGRDGADEQHIADLSERLERAERERESLAKELTGATAFWSSGLGAMEARVTEIAASRGEDTRKVDDEVVSALFDLARRLDAVERASSEADTEVVRTAESWAAERHSLAAGLDELAQRLDSLGEEGERPSAAAPPTRDDASEGRARLELRALELRMEHAEAAARENRDAVLVQLERLASRIEWRLQRLETGKDEGPLPEAADGPLAQVVSIHGGDA